MIRLSRAALPILLVVALAAPAGADHCAWRRISEPEFQGWGFYVDNDLCQLECILSVWVYQESNGIDGLQRHDAVVDDTCGGEIEGDTLILGGMPLATDAL